MISVKRLITLEAALGPLLSWAVKEQVMDTMTLAKEIVTELKCKRALKPVADSLVGALPLMKPAVEPMSLRIAGNWDRLSDGLSIHPTVKAQTVSETCLFRVRSVDEHPESPESVKVMVQVCTGTSAGRKFNIPWSINKIAYFSELMGHAKFNPNSSKDPPTCMFEHPTDIVGLYAAIHILAAQRDTPQRFGAVVVRGTERSYNRAIIRLRKRDGVSCPEGRPDNFPCRECVRGYDSCRAAVRPKALPLSVTTNGPASK